MGCIRITDGEQARLSGWLRDGGSLHNIGILRRKQWLRRSGRRVVASANYRNDSDIILVHRICFGAKSETSLFC